MRQRYVRDYRPLARCRAHGPYPLNFRYRGASFANNCPKCDPKWRPQLEAMRDAELRKHETDHVREDER